MVTCLSYSASPSHWRSFKFVVVPVAYSSFKILVVDKKRDHIPGLDSPLKTYLLRVVVGSCWAVVIVVV